MNKGSASTFSVPTAPGVVNGPQSTDKTSVTRQLFSGEGKRMGFGSPNAGSTKVSMSSMPGQPNPTPSGFNVRQDGRMQQPNRGGNPANRLVPGTVKVLQRPSTTAGQSKNDPQTMPIGQNQSTTTITTQTVTASNANLSMSSSGEFSPFDNFFGNATEQLLGKKDEANERINFASVAAAGLVSSYPGTMMMNQDPSISDPALQAKAPGFKPTNTGPRMPVPMSDMNPAFRAPMFPMQNQFMDIGMQGFPSFQPGPPHPGFGTQSPNMSPRSSQSSTAGLSPRSNGSGFDPQMNQKEEYTTPNQPMTLPKINSSLNPNAPDFTSRSIGGGSPFQGQGPPLFANTGGLPISYNQELAKQLMSVFGTISPSGGTGVPMGNPSSGSPIPGAVDALSGMQPNQQELFQNMANQLMHQLTAVQGQGPGSPGLVPGFSSVPRPFSPLGPGRPSSAPSMGGILSRGGSPIALQSFKNNG